MNIKNAKTAVSSYKKFMFGVGGLFALVECAFIFMLLPYIQQLQVPLTASLVLVFLALLLPALCMPFVYAVINSSTIISTGRYHLPLVICSLLVALANVLFFSLETLSPALGGVFLFLTLFLASLSLQIFIYVYFSIGARMDYVGKVSVFRALFSFLGVAATAVLLLLVFDGSVKSIENVAYVVSTVACAALSVVYLGSYTAMPFFIRIEPASKYTVKQNYKRYLQPLKIKKSRTVLIGAMLTACGALLSVLCIHLIAGALNVNNGFNYKVALCGLIAVGAVAVPIFRFVFKDNVDKRIVMCTILSAAFSCLVFAGIAVLLFVNVPTFARNVILYVLSLLYGVCLAPLVAARAPLKNTIKEVTGNSDGNLTSITNAVLAVALAISAAMAIGALIAQTVNAKITSAVVLFACAAFIITGACLLKYALGVKKDRIKVNKIKKQDNAEFLEGELAGDGDDSTSDGNEPLVMESVDKLLFKEEDDV